MKPSFYHRPLRSIIISISLLWCNFAISSQHSAERIRPVHRIFDYETGQQGRKAFLRLPDNDTRAILLCHQNMTEEVLFRSTYFCHKMDSMGIAMMFVQRGSQNWDINDGCAQRLDSIINTFATLSGQKGISKAPIIPFGHSAQATFPWNFAAWNKSRTLCIISYHGDAPRTNLCGYGRENLEWGRTRNIDSIPGLMIMGEYEWMEERIRPAMAFRMMYPESRISFLCDAGRGHFDLSETTQQYIFKFIEKSLNKPRPAGGELYSRWYSDGHESTDPHEQFWYHDSEMVNLTAQRYAESRNKRPQYVSATINGRLLEYDPSRHIKCNGVVSDEEFYINPVFVNASRDSISDFHTASLPRVVLISGPAVQTGNNSFKIDFDYFGNDDKRLWSGITLCIEVDADSTFNSAVQEVNLQLSKELLDRIMQQSK